MKTRRVVVAVALALSVAFIGRQLQTSWASISDEPLPGIGPLLAAFALFAVGQLLIGEALVAVGTDPPTAGSRRWAFHLTQPAKYIPAGVAQAAGLIAALVHRGASGVPAAMWWAVHTGSLVIAGIAIGLTLAPALGWAPVVVAGGLLMPVLLFRPVLVGLLRPVGRYVPAVADPDVVPPQAALSRCLAGAILGIALHGCAYAVLVDAGEQAGVDTATAIAAYGLAMGLSIATPLPGGLGAREALLLGLTDLTGSAAFVPIVVARILVIGVELVLWLAATAWPRRGAGDVESELRA